LHATERALNASETPPTLYRFRFGSVEFDQQRQELRVAGVGVDIQPRPLKLLSCLLARPGEVITKDELLDQVWEGRPTVENVIANAVTKLRAVLGELDAARIVTLPRVGYRFDGPVERVAVGRSLTSGLALAPGSVVPGRPNFLLERLLSRTVGSNEVWLARHAKTGERRVYKFSPDGSSLAMLKREATVSRLLRTDLGDRPDLVRVIDWNFESPPFFLECEYGGANLQEWAREGQLTGLTHSKRLELFLQIADAVSAANGVGVLHKDLKPANVLVAPRADGSLHVRLTDFGSSRLLDPDRLAALGITRLGLTLTSSALADSSGTPLYLAPELVGGAPSTLASDVYALGVMLYQMLLGDLGRPLAPGWERAIGDPILREDIAAATDGDPAQRLPSVGELTVRLRRLDARRAQREQERAAALAARNALEILQRSRARRPWMMAAVVLLVTGLGTSLWLYQGARRATGRTDAINDFLYRDVLSNTGALKTDSDPDPSMRRVLNEAAASVGTRFANDPASEGWIRMAIGEGLAGLGDYKAGETQQRRAVGLLKGAGDADPAKILVASYTLAMTLLEQSKFAEAEAALSDISRLTDTSLRNTETAMKSFGLRGMLRATRKDCTQALPDLTAAAQIPLPPTDEYLYNRFNLRSWIAQTLICLNKPTEAAALYGTLLADTSSLKAAGPALIGYAHLGRAKALQRLGQIDSARRELAEALRTLEQGVGESDSFTLGEALVEAGSFYVEMREFDVAADYLLRGRKLLLQVGDKQEKALNALRLLGTIDYLRGNPGQAIDKLSAAREGLAEVFGEASPDVQGTNFWLASAFADTGRVAEAAKLAGELDPQALQASLGRDDWGSRIDTLQKSIERRRP
jgi:eukaryotic-like serine/threonine-protein kinase